MGDIVCLEAIRLFPATTRTFTNRLRSDIVQRYRIQCHVFELDVIVSLDPMMCIFIYTGKNNVAVRFLEPLLTYLHTYLLTYLLHGAQSFLRS